MTATEPPRYYRREDSGPLAGQLLHELAAAEMHANAVLHDTSACGYPHHKMAAAMAGEEQNSGPAD